MTVKIEDDRLKELCHLKMAQQLSWTALAREYESLYDEEISWRSLRAVLLRDAPASYWSGNLEDDIVATLDAFFEKAHIAQMAAYVVLETFREWKMLQDIYMRWRVERHTLSTAERKELGEDAIRFEEKDLERLDDLKKEVKEFFLTVSRQANLEGAVIINILEGGSATMALGGDKQQVALAGAIEARISEQAGVIEADLRKLHAEHREEAKGIYRPINESLNYDDEDDIAI